MLYWWHQWAIELTGYGDLRPMDKKQWKKLYKNLVALGNPPYSVHDKINENGAVYNTLRKCVEGGKLGVVRSGMDCDHSAYRREYAIEAPRGVKEWLRDEAKHQYWLDGPEATTLCRPSEIDSSRNWSRDLAAEAFENGHPHYIIY